MSHWYVCHDSFICVSWLVHMCATTRHNKSSAMQLDELAFWKREKASSEWCYSFIRVPWLIHTCDMTYSYVRHDSFICLTWLIRNVRGSRSERAEKERKKERNAWRDSFTRVPWLIHMCDMTHSAIFKVMHPRGKRRRACVYVRCSVLQCVAVCCSVLQCVAEYRAPIQSNAFMWKKTYSQSTYLLFHRTWERRHWHQLCRQYSK